MQTGVKVKLITDLTQYLPGAIVGTEGVTIGQYGMWSRNYGTFTGVNFPGLGKLDVLIKSLEIIDADYLSQVQKEDEQLHQDLATATDIVVTRGPRGGFRSLEFKYCKGYRSTSFSQEADEFLQCFEQLKLPIKTNYT